LWAVAEESLQELREAVQRRPEDVEALTRLGIALSGDGQHEEAVRILTKVAGRCKDVSSAHADRGMALLAAGAVDEALAEFKRARDLDGDSAQAYCGLGLVWQQRGNWWEAADAFRMVERLAPRSPIGALNLGLALEALGEHEQARQALLRAALLAPGDGEIREALDHLAVPELVENEISRPVLRGEEFGASIAGELQNFQILDVLEFLRMGGKTGALLVSSRGQAGAVRLVRGRVTSASAPGVKRLGESLVEEGVLRPEELAAALSRQQSDREEVLGTLLLREGIVDGPQLNDAVFRQIMGSLDEMLDWSEGSFSFNVGSDELPPPISFSLQEITLKLVKLRDHRSHQDHNGHHD
jgi:Flp pilus assembly protein TadD